MRKNIFTASLCFVLMMLVSPIFAQVKEIKGRVFDDSKTPLPGVMVVVDGTANGAITDNNGDFVVQADSKTGSLTFSFVGMQELTVKINNKTQLEVVLQPQDLVVDDVVVIGYGAVSKKELTGAVAQVKADELAQSITADLGNAIQGAVAGVNVSSSSGSPGESADIVIRGISSVTGSNTPLYVVDGVPQEGDPRLATNEIETIDILKDAASCAIYGTRGAAGVILITTKRGTEGKPKVDISSTYGIQFLSDAVSLMNADQKAYYEQIYYRNNNAGKYDNDNSPTIQKNASMFTNDTDMRDVIFRNGVSTQNHTLNISGGGNGIVYNVSASYYDTEGVLVNTDFNRLSTRANITYKQNKLTLGTNISVSSEKQAYGSPTLIQSALKYSPYLDTIEAGTTGALYTETGPSANQLSNILSYLNVTDQRNTLKLQTTFTGAYDFTKNLSLKTNFSYSESNLLRSYFKPNQEIWLWTSDSDYEEGGYYELSDSYNKTSSSSVLRANTRKESTTWDMSLTYKLKIKDHTFNFLGAFSTESYTYDIYTAVKYGVIDNNIDNFNSTTVDANVYSGSDYTNTLVGSIGRVLYDWKSRYMISVSGRVDGSSKFSAANRWGFFPSVSGAWNISDEAFFKGLKEKINTFKLRASYGTTGNQNFSSYSYSNSMEYGYDYAFGTSGEEEYFGAVQDTFGNSEIKWETTIQSNFGIDLAFFNNKLLVTAEYYNTRKEDMLFSVDMPSSVGNYGGTTMILNVGNMTNTGYEFAVTHSNRIGGFQYKINATFATNDNVITYMPGVDSGTIVLTTNSGINGGQITGLCEGYEAGAFFLYTTDGIVNTEEKLAYYQTLRSDAVMGDLMYVDINNDGVIDDNDRSYKGSGTVEYEAGLNLTASYKNFDFSAQFYAALGHEIMNGTKAIAYYNSVHENLYAQWSETNPLSPIPAVTTSDYNYIGYTDVWMEDGSYLRLKNITLGYSLPKATLNKLKLTKCRVYVTASNPLTLTNYSGYNPEVGGTVISKGIDTANYPATSTVTAGVNISF